MTGTPWLNDDGTYVCFYCTTGTTRAGRQRDRDAVHAGLRESHRILLSRPLPNGDSWSFQPARGWYLKSVEPRTGEPLEWSVGSDNFATTHTNALLGMAEKIPGDHRKPVVLHEESLSSRYDTQEQPLVRDPPSRRPRMREPPDARQMHSAKTLDAEHAEKRGVSTHPRIGSSP